MTNATTDTGAPRVALVTNVLSHYRVPCFQRLAERFPGRITFYFLAAEMEHRDYVLARGRVTLPAVFLEGRRWRRPPDDDLHWNDVRPILAGGYDAVILGGWSEPTFLHLWLRHLWRPAKVLFWTESTLHDRPRSLPREALKRLLLRGAAGCLVPGLRAREYCRDLGMPEPRIFTAPNATDRGYFQRRAEALLPERRALRHRFGVADRIEVLFVGRLVESIKGVSTLLRAVARLQDRDLPIVVTLAGEGPDLGHYRRLAADLPCRDVRFLGNLDHDELCRRYAAADLLALPSRSEVWGFVLNEGMEFGLPLVVSEAVGAGPDLVTPGENGYVVPVDDPRKLAEAIAAVAADGSRRRAMGVASRRRIERFSPEAWARGAEEAVLTTTARGRG